MFSLIDYGDVVGDRVIFDMGAATGFVFIDNVIVTELVDVDPPTAFTATKGTVGGLSVDLLLNATDDSGTVKYNISYNGGANTVQTTGTSGVQKTFKVTGLTPLTPYTFSVTASDAAGNTAANNPIIVNATTIADTNTACAGTSTEAREGTFSSGYTYAIETLPGGTSVKYTFEVLDTDKPSLCCAQLHKILPDEFIDMTNPSGQIFTGIVTNLTPGQVISYAGRFPFIAAGLVETKLLQYTVGDTCALGTGDFDIVSASAYPNPTSNSWTISAKNSDISSIAVYDILGKNVLSVKSNSSEVKVDASSLKSGIYFATINTTNGSSTLKLIKE